MPRVQANHSFPDAFTLIALSLSSSLAPPCLCRSSLHSCCRCPSMETDGLIKTQCLPSLRFQQALYSGSQWSREQGQREGERERERTREKERRKLMSCRYSAVILLFLLHCCKRKSTPIQLSLPNPLAAPHYCNVSLIQCPATASTPSVSNCL